MFINCALLGIAHMNDWQNFDVHGLGETIGANSHQKYSCIHLAFVNRDIYKVLVTNKVMVKLPN